MISNGSSKVTEVLEDGSSVLRALREKVCRYLDLVDASIKATLSMDPALNQAHTALRTGLELTSSVDKDAAMCRAKQAIDSVRQARITDTSLMELRRDLAEMEIRLDHQIASMNAASAEVSSMRQPRKAVVNFSIVRGSLWSKIMGVFR